ncbi:MAG: hypothetical protein CMJ31_04880 [Phycisphaerae bacterium]|nr:hypothetical protein [Phycisphaerae bacterium]
MPTLRNHAAAALIAAMGGGSICLLGGCDTRSDAERAFEETTYSLRTTSVNGATASDRNALLAGAERSINTAVSGGEEHLAGAAALVRSEIKQGMASERRVELAEAQNRVLTLSKRLRDLAAIYRDEHATADGLLRFDPSGDISDLEDRADQRDRQASEIGQRLAELNSERSELEGQISTLDTASVDARRRAAELTDRAGRMSATDAAGLGESIHRYTRQADTKKKEAERLRARRDATLTPAIEELEATMSQRRQQAQLIRDAINRLETQKSDAESRAATHRANAATVATEAADIVEELDGARNLIDAISADVLNVLEAAVSDARRANRETPEIAKSVSAGANRRLAEVRVSVADGMLDEASAREALADAQPPVAYAAELRQAARSLRDRANELGRGAVEAYEASAQDLTGSRPRGVNGDSLQATAERVDALARRIATRYGQAPEPAPEAVEAEPDTTEAPGDDS